MSKERKPGQFYSLGGKLFRIKERTLSLNVCSNCAALSHSLCSADQESKKYPGFPNSAQCWLDLGSNWQLEEIKPKQ